jgi:GNAT superfamily N-acetyltransferase
VAEIHTLEEDRWRDIREIRLRALGDTPDAFTSTLARESAYDETTWRRMATTGRWFVAEDGAPVGVAIGVDGWSEDANVRELVGMWVAPTHRQRGIARQLLEHVKDWATGQGARTLRLGVRESNQRAFFAYVSMGMRPSGESMPEEDNPKSLIIMMECDLGPT